MYTLWLCLAKWARVGAETCVGAGAGDGPGAGRARKLPFLECKQASDSPSSEGKGHSGATSRFWRSF
ncbi:hypothetical protein Tco_1380621 [Tanacetum coccineum]